MGANIEVGDVTSLNIADDISGGPLKYEMVQREMEAQGLIGVHYDDQPFNPVTEREGEAKGSVNALSECAATTDHFAIADYSHRDELLLGPVQYQSWHYVIESDGDVEAIVSVNKDDPVPKEYQDERFQIIKAIQLEESIKIPKTDEYERIYSYSNRPTAGKIRQEDVVENVAEAVDNLL